MPSSIDEKSPIDEKASYDDGVKDFSKVDAEVSVAELRDDAGRLLIMKVSNNV